MMMMLMIMMMMMMMMMMLMMMLIMLRYFLHTAVHRELFKSRPPHIRHRHSSPRGGDDADDDCDNFEDDDVNDYCGNDDTEQIKSRKKKKRKVLDL